MEPKHRMRVPPGFCEQEFRLQTVVLSSGVNAEIWHGLGFFGSIIKFSFSNSPRGSCDKFSQSAEFGIR